MLDKMFESLDEKVFTPELKSDLTEKFEAAVKAKAEEIAKEGLDEKIEVKAAEIASEKIEEKIQELETLSEEVKTKLEEHKEKLEEEYKEKESELTDQVDTYLEKVVDDFVAESKESLEESLKDEKADMIIEAMDAMITSTGVKISQITEAKDSLDAESKLKELTEKYDTLVEENIKLEKQKVELVKKGVIEEISEGLDVIDTEKFNKMADMINFDSFDSFVEKLQLVRESIGSSKQKDVKKDVKKDVLEEKHDKESVVTSFNHLI